MKRELKFFSSKNTSTYRLTNILEELGVEEKYFISFFSFKCERWVFVGVWGIRIRKGCIVHVFYSGFLLIRKSKILYTLYTYIGYKTNVLLATCYPVNSSWRSSSKKLPLNTNNLDNLRVILRYPHPGCFLQLLKIPSVFTI